MRPYLTGTSSATRDPACRSSSSTGSARREVGAKTAWSSSGALSRARLPAATRAIHASDRTTVSLRRRPGSIGWTLVTRSLAMPVSSLSNPPRGYASALAFSWSNSACVIEPASSSDFADAICSVGDEPDPATDLM